MPDWTRLIAVSSRFDPLARRLAEIEQIESSLDLDAAAALAHCDRMAAEPTAMLRLAQACTLVADALLRDLMADETPPEPARLAAIAVDYRSGAMPAGERLLWERHLFAIALRTHMLEGHSAVAVEPTFEGIPILEEVLALDASSAVAAPESLGAQETRLARYRLLLEAARPSPDLSAGIAARAGIAAHRLSRDWRRLGDIERAIASLDEAATFYERAGRTEDAAEARRDAEDLRHAAVHDIDSASAEDLRGLIRGALPPLERARALARLSQFAIDANALFDAAAYAEGAAAALADAGFPDPGAAVGVEAALTAWVAEIGKRVEAGGGRPEQIIGDAGRLWADILAARHGRALDDNAAAADRLERVLIALGEAIAKGLRELAAAHDAIARKLVRYEPRLRTSSPNRRSDRDREAQEISNRLHVVQLAANDAHGADDGVALDAALGAAQACLADARHLGDAFTIALGCFVCAYVYDFMDATDLAIASAIEGEEILLGGTPASPERLLERNLLALLLDLRGVRISALLRRGEDEARFSLSRDCIKLLEARRRHVADPLQRAAFLSGRTFFYEMNAHAAFRLGRWDDLLAAMELMKAGRYGTSRTALASDKASAEIEARLAEETRILADASRGSDTWSAASAKIRLLINALSIERRNTTATPDVSVEALQAALAADEAAIGWVWVARGVLIVVAIRREGICVDRVALTVEEVETLDAYVTLLGATRPDLSGIETYATRLVSATFPETIRKFVADVRRLTLSPHRALHLLPFHALRWNGDAFLIDRAAISYAPNFGCLLRPSDAASPETDGGVVAIGVDRFAVAGEHWPDLAAAEAEAEAIAAIWRRHGRQGEAFVGEQATVSGFDRLQQRLAKCRGLHIATHGVSIFAPEAENDPYASRLVLRDGSLSALRIRQLRLSADLVVLSVCNGGQRALKGRGLEQMPGDDMFGLQAAFFEAGAKAVISALWPVYDAVAKRLMTELHSKLAAGTATDVALQQAMIAEAQRAGTRRRISVWAPFFLNRVQR